MKTASATRIGSKKFADCYMPRFIGYHEFSFAKEMAALSQGLEKT